MPDMSNRNNLLRRIFLLISPFKKNFTLVTSATAGQKEFKNLILKQKPGNGLSQRGRGEYISWDKINLKFYICFIFLIFQYIKNQLYKKFLREKTKPMTTSNLM